MEQKIIQEENELKQFFKPNLIKSISRMKNSDLAAHKTMSDVNKSVPSKINVNVENSNQKVNNMNEIKIQKELYKQFHNFQKQHLTNEDIKIENNAQTENQILSPNCKIELNKKVTGLIDPKENKKKIIKKEIVAKNFQETNLEKIGEEIIEDDIQDKVDQEIIDDFIKNDSANQNNSFEINEMETPENEKDISIQIQQIREANPIQTLNNLCTISENSYNLNFIENNNNKNSNSNTSNYPLRKQNINDQLKAFDLCNFNKGGN